MASSLERFFYKTFYTPRKLPERFGGDYFYSIGSTKDIFNSENYIQDFLSIPELSAILNIKARAMSSWELFIESKATGLAAPANESLVRILRSPNWFQGQSEFWKQSSLYRDIFGNEYLYFLTPVGMNNTYKGLFTLDPSKVIIEYKGSKAFFSESTNEGVSYFYDIGDNEKILLEKEKLIHLNDNRLQSGKNFLKGTSKLKALQPALQNIKAAYQKRNIVLNMPVGIISNNQGDATGYAIPLNPEEKKNAQEQIRNRGGLPFITGLSVNYSDMNVNSNSLGLFEETKEDTAKICDAFGVPYEVLASQKGTTFTNLKEAKKQMYEESVIPDAEEKIDALNLALGTDKKSWHVIAKWSHLPVFSEDVKQRAISLKQTVEALNTAIQAGIITQDQAKEELKRYGID